MYTIGHVLYVVLSKKNQVYPMQVVEVITKKTLSGEEVSYILQAGSDKSSKVDLSSIEGEIFNTAEKARKTLVERATMQINKLIEVATKKAAEWYGENDKVEPQSIQNLPDLSIPQINKDSEEKFETVTMPDGSLAKIRIPKIVNESM